MKLKSIYSIAALVLLLTLVACSSRVVTRLDKTYPATDINTRIHVFNLNDAVPDSAEVIGEVKIGDSGFSTNCDYEVAITHAKYEARKAGGNALKIIKYKSPSALGSSCHRITAQILKVNNVEQYIDEVLNTVLDVDYAIVHVYRFGGPGGAVNYKLRLDDTVLCKVRSSYKTTLHVKKEGTFSLWAKTESVAKVNITLEHGKTYYIKCGISIGAFVGRPTIRTMKNDIAKVEFEYFDAGTVEDNIQIEQKKE